VLEESDGFDSYAEQRTIMKSLGEQGNKDTVLTRISSPGTFFSQLISFRFWQRIHETARPTTHDFWANVIERIGIKNNGSILLTID